MSVNTAIEQLLEVEQNRGENGKAYRFSPFWLVYNLRQLPVAVIWFFDYLAAYGEDTMCVGFARLGSEDQKIVAGTMKQLESVDFGAPLHCLVIAGKTHPVEEEMLDFYRTVWITISLKGAVLLVLYAGKCFPFRFLSSVLHFLVIRLLNGLSLDLSVYSKVTCTMCSRHRRGGSGLALKKVRKTYWISFLFLGDATVTWLSRRSTSNNTILYNLHIWLGW